MSTTASATPTAIRSLPGLLLTLSCTFFGSWGSCARLWHLEKKFKNKKYIPQRQEGQAGTAVHRLAAAAVVGVEVDVETYSLRLRWDYVDEIDTLVELALKFFLRSYMLLRP